MAQFTECPTDIQNSLMQALLDYMSDAFYKSLSMEQCRPIFESNDPEVLRENWEGGRPHFIPLASLNLICQDLRMEYDSNWG